jgi:hypothetical protein
MAHRATFTVETRGRGTYDVTACVVAALASAPRVDGVAHVFCHHTSASLILCENADPSVRRDPRPASQGGWIRASKRSPRGSKMAGAAPAGNELRVRSKVAGPNAESSGGTLIMGPPCGNCSAMLDQLIHTGT